MDAAFTRFATHISRLTGSSVAFVLATLAIVAWAILDRPFDWLDGISALTFWMLFSLQSSQNADTTAIQTKLDELITHLDGPRNEIAGIEDRPS